MGERKGAVTMRGNPLTLVGNEIKVGDSMPDVALLDNALSQVKLSAFRGKNCVLVSVPSLDTPVCDMESRRFNEEASRLGTDLAILIFSMDMPFAQKRWFGAAGVTKVQTLTYHRESSFGNAFGVLIKELRLLARAVFVVDKKGAIRYIQLVKEVAQEPNYQEVLEALKKL
jgi:thiol peroxidase